MSGLQDCDDTEIRLQIVFLVRGFTSGAGAKYRLVSATFSPYFFSQGERLAVQLPLDRALALRKYWHLDRRRRLVISLASRTQPIQVRIAF